MASTEAGCAARPVQSSLVCVNDASVKHHVTRDECCRILETNRQARHSRNRLGIRGGGRLAAVGADTLESTQKKLDYMTDAAELNEPVQDGSNDATREQKIAGLARQVAADLVLHPEQNLLTDLVQRLSDAGITVDEDELMAIAGTIALGD